jgi:hypothetical protein
VTSLSPQDGDLDSWRTFFHVAEAVLHAGESADRRLRLQLGSGFNVFDWIGPKENGLSAILADLLDPEGTHGQSDTFLKLALENLFVVPMDVKPVDTRHCVVIREAGTADGRRIDLLIDADSRRASIAIEKKPWADEGEEQLEAYAKYLSQRHNGESYCLIFLYGQSATVRSLSKELRTKLDSEGRFQTVPYYHSTGSSLYGWLVESAKICQAEKVRLFLQDFADYVATEFKDAKKGDS